MLVEAQERAEREGKQQDSAPPMSSWTPEVDVLHTIADRLGGLGYLIRASNGDKQAKPPPALPRPKTALPKIKQQRRMEQHKKLAARLLGR
jgi:hypothetical protein